jgi:hypothetical protein
METPWCDLHDWEARARGWTVSSIGPLALRTETVAAAVLGAVRVGRDVLIVPATAKSEFWSALESYGPSDFLWNFGARRAAPRASRLERSYRRAGHWNFSVSVFSRVSAILFGCQ